MYRNCNSRAYGPPFGRGLYSGQFMLPFAGFKRPKYNVPVNIQEAEAHFTVSVYATNFDKENIKLNVSDDVFYISGTRSIDENNNPEFLSQEFPVKSFERAIQLNGQVDVEGITAKQENGVLYIHLPKSEKAKKQDRQIKVD